MKETYSEILQLTLSMGDNFNQLMSQLLASLEHHAWGVLLVILLILATSLWRHGWPPKK